jgi:hypothetical protein
VPGIRRPGRDAEQWPSCNPELEMSGFTIPSSYMFWRQHKSATVRRLCYVKSPNPLNTDLNPICHLLALLEAHHILHVSRVRFNPFPTNVQNMASF